MVGMTPQRRTKLGQENWTPLSHIYKSLDLGCPLGKSVTVYKSLDLDLSSREGSSLHLRQFPERKSAMIHKPPIVPAVESIISVLKGESR